MYLRSRRAFKLELPRVDALPPRATAPETACREATRSSIALPLLKTSTDSTTAMRSSTGFKMSLPPVACATKTATGKVGRECSARECPRCVSLILLHKCASTTLLAVLGAPAWRAPGFPNNSMTTCGGVYYCDWMAYGASGCRANSLTPRELADGKGAWLYYGGYLQTIAPQIHLQRHCQRFALFREPVSRLLSARAYCAKGTKGRPAAEGGDVLCGNRSHGSIADWAAHWGSYLFRQLALDPTIYASLAGSSFVPLTPRCTRDACTRASRFSWLDQRAAFGRHDGFESGGSAPARHALKSLSQRMATGHLFDVVGIYESWGASMALLDATLPLPAGRKWTVESHTRRANSRSDRRADDERKAIADARAMPQVRNLLSADIRLYHAGTQWFRVLCQRHSIALPSPQPSTASSVY